MISPFFSLFLDLTRLPKTTCVWGEPLITALDVGHGYDKRAMMAATQPEPKEDDGEFKIAKKDGSMFDCVDMCIEEGSRNCIFGPTASGKSTLLKILAKKIHPMEGTVHHASGIRPGYYDPDAVDEMIATMSTTTTALDYMTTKYPQKTDQDLRGHLTAFGLSPTTQAKTPVCYLSGGEKYRFVLANIMMEDPPVLCLDDPTSHLDVESVQALIYGLRQWNGTLIMVSQDANFLRSLEDVKCVVIMPDEGKLRRVEGGMDAYLKSFQL
jgi:ATP-binding cassette subfamily F protein 3